VEDGITKVLSIKVSVREILTGEINSSQVVALANDEAKLRFFRFAVPGSFFENLNEEDGKSDRGASQQRYELAHGARFSTIHPRENKRRKQDETDEEGAYANERPGGCRHSEPHKEDSRGENHSQEERGDQTDEAPGSQAYEVHKRALKRGK
jgi:hypothetical protein